MSPMMLPIVYPKAKAGIPAMATAATAGATSGTAPSTSGRLSTADFCIANLALSHPSLNAPTVAPIPPSTTPAAPAAPLIVEGTGSMTEDTPVWTLTNAPRVVWGVYWLFPQFVKNLSGDPDTGIGVYWLFLPRVKHTSGE